MAAWSVEINDLGEGADLGMGDRITIAAQFQFFFTKDEIDANRGELGFLKDVDEIDRLMLPENYQEWQCKLRNMMTLAMINDPEAADINGDRVDMPTPVTRVTDSTEDLERDLGIQIIDVNTETLDRLADD